MNRNKRSITVNFKEPEGLAIVHKLISQADVLVENYISGKLATMGLGWEDCQKINPRLIYASVTGYGQTGPYAKAAGYDVIIEAEAGLMHMCVRWASQTLACSDTVIAQASPTVRRVKWVSPQPISRLDCMHTVP